MPGCGSFRIRFPTYRDNRQDYLHSSCHHNGWLGHRHHNCFLFLSIVGMNLNVELTNYSPTGNVILLMWVVVFPMCFCVGDVPVCGDDTWRILRQLLATLLTLKFHFTYTSRVQTHVHMFAVHIIDQCVTSI